MATQVEEDEVLEVEEEQTLDTEETPAPEEEAPEEEIREEEEEGADDDDEDVVVTLGEDPEEEEEEHQEAPKWVKEVRKKNRHLETEVKKLKRQLEEKAAAATPKVELGDKPTLKTAKYDEKEYERQLAAYYERKRLVDAQANEAKKLAEQQTKLWEERQARYTTQRSTHSFPDFKDAEDLVSSTLSNTQQSIIIQGAEDSALLVYALGKNPKKLAELAAVKNPVDFAVKVGKLESQLRVAKKKAPAPEKRVSGKTGGLGGSSDATLERLRAEAEKTGDYSKVLKYKNSLKKE